MVVRAVPCPRVKGKKISIRPIFIRFWLPVIAWMIVISAISSAPADNIPDLGLVGADKFVHFTEFLVFGMILLRALSGSNLKINLFWMVVLSIIISCFYAAIDELHQLLVPGRPACLDINSLQSGRQADIFDFLADTAGAILGAFLYFKRSLSCRR